MIRGIGLCCAITVLAVIPNVGDVIADALSCFPALAGVFDGLLARLVLD